MSQIKKLVQDPPMSLDDWGAQLDEGMNSWRMMIPGARSTSEVRLSPPPPLSVPTHHKPHTRTPAGPESDGLPAHPQGHDRGG